MNERKKARILDYCLSAIRSGKLSQADCIRKYPELERDLNDLLSVAGRLYSLPAIPMAKDRLRQSKINLLNQLPDRQEFVTKPADLRFKFQIHKRRFAMTWVIIVSTLLSLISGAGVVSASSDALPGDTLYPVKIWMENVQLAVAPDEVDTQLNLKFMEYRFQEMITLSNEGRYDDLNEAVKGYQNRTQLLEQTMAEIQAKDPDKALKLRTELEQQLQEQAHRMEAIQVSGGNGDQIQEQLRDMLQTNTQTRLRIRVSQDEPIQPTVAPTVSNDIPAIETAATLTPDADGNGVQNQDGELVNTFGNGETVTFTFRLRNAVQNGVAAEVAGVQYPCSVNGDLVTCNINGAPSQATVNLYSLKDHNWLFSYDYDYDWYGEKTPEGSTYQNQDQTPSNNGGSGGNGGSGQGGNPENGNGK
jgi:hypothetical protein